MNEQDVQIIERAWAEDAAGETLARVICLRLVYV